MIHRQQKTRPRSSSSSAANRFRRARRLKALGAAALPAIKAGVTSADAETARRCKSLLSAIRNGESESFVAGKKKHDSPAWTSFKTLVGDSKESRQLFVEMMADDRRADAIEQAETNPAKAHEVYAAALERANESLAKAFNRFMGQPISDALGKAAQAALKEAVSPAELAMILFVGRQPLPDGAKDPACREMLFSSGFADAIGGPMKKQFQKLFAAWFDRRRDTKALQAGVSATLNFALKDGVPVSRRLLGDKAMPPILVGRALLVVGHHGIQQDLPLLRGFRDDSRVTSTAGPPGGEQMGTQQVRDFAAAMSLLLAGQDFDNFGFGSDAFLNWYISSTQAPYRSVSLFKSDADRAAALKKAWEWLDSRAKVEAQPPAP
jgi:hypothetical protein